MVERRSPKPSAGGSSPSWPANGLWDETGNRIKGTVFCLFTCSLIYKLNLDGYGVYMEYVDKARDYFKEVVAELKRVTWPTKKDTMAATWVVIITVIILSVFLGIVDLGLSQSIKLIIK